MIHRNICPICGSENPEGSEFCQVCKANLAALPDSIYPTDNEAPEQEQLTAPETKTQLEEETDLDQPVPGWLADKLKPSEKKPIDFNTYSDLLFGVPDTRKPNPPAKVSRPQKAKKADPVYQPPLQDIIEPPLIEPDDNSPKSITEDIPGIADFLLQRPARKWEDQKPKPVNKKTSSISLLTDFSKERPAKKWDDAEPGESADSSQYQSLKKTDNISQPSLWWQQDAPLVELTEAEDNSKTTQADDPALDNSVSPTKVAEAAEIFNSETEQSSSRTRNEADEFKPESGSLISDLLNEMNSNSASLTPSERQENEDGTVFFSGNRPTDEGPVEQQPEVTEISISEEDNAASAEMLDRILRNIGYEVAGEPKPEETKNEEPAKDEIPISGQEEKNTVKEKRNRESSGKTDILKPLRGFFIPQVIDNPLIPDDDDELSEKDADPYGLEDGEIPEKEDFVEELDIPWDLFGSADMALPQSPEDPAYRTFSRKDLPEDPGSTSYQQRMISSILGKIIQAENFVQPPQEKNNREISLAARLILSVLAIVGVVLIMNSNLTDNIQTPNIPVRDESKAFYDTAANTLDEALVVIDYTPAYNDLMAAPTEKLIGTLTNHAESVYLAALNPSAMPNIQQIRNLYSEKTNFAGWWPGGVISIRARLAAGDIPENIWLLTTESSSVRVWAEQISSDGSERHLHVMGPEQLQPLLKPYLQSGMIDSMLANEFDLANYGEEDHSITKGNLAVWYLAALVPLAWLFGIVGKVMKSEPNYGRKSTVKDEEPQLNTEKESEND
ncbi:MAG: hypothetical protein IJI41_08920 [Anaerolineaceae bacterium]|nr:hypothetical protein [Anaerolineaceae bacterium]